MHFEAELQAAITISRFLWNPGGTCNFSAAETLDFRDRYKEFNEV